MKRWKRPALPAPPPAPDTIPPRLTRTELETTLHGPGGRARVRALRAHFEAFGRDQAVAIENTEKLLLFLRALKANADAVAADAAHVLGEAEA